ncbi:MULTISPECIES: iron ABC transporter permease [Virgibacillus]|uniref:iron ABC transporter permease n=1 Tax=Virgibacillus TaxID=84406 RepID=UPI000388396E|nr:MULTISPECIES: iron ABC transporter permease [Virgibacillus]EQB37880.1 iron ABC transporter permease [Virgibacillus sp. CM-4]MYL40606.1 iron chelate uptake ABC transporter family permease subunit [Virgibacillus massiliensis]
MKVKPILFIFGCFLLFLVLGLIHLSQGQASSGFITFWLDVWNNDQELSFLLYNRMPRFVIGCLAGAALAVAGMLLQTMTKNPLASASTLGIHAGAYFFVVLFTIFFPSISGGYPIIVTMAGGIAAALSVTFLVGKSLDPVRIALTGLIVTMLFSSFTSALQLLYENEVSGLFLWGSGTLLQLDWSGVQFATPWIIGILVVAILVSRRFDILLLGDEVAIGLGQNITLSKAFGWVIAILLASVTVTVVGPIGFVGIIAPHLVRLMGFQTHRTMIIANVLVGASLLISADIFVRIISDLSELPVGAMTAIIGAPWLVYLALKMSTQTRSSGNALEGKERIERDRRKIFYPILSLGILILVVISLSFGGTSFTNLLALPQELMYNSYVWDFRVPRVVVSFAVGMMMAASGLLMQTVLRNPLADASVLGITSGASVIAMLFIVVFPQAPFIFVPIGALLGALLTMVIVLIISSKSGFQPMILLLMGIAMSAVGAALIQILLVRANVHASQALTWLSGSTYGMSWDDLVMALLAVILIIPIIIWLAKPFEILSFGDEISIGLGVRTSRMRLLMIVLGVVLSAISVSIVGAIGFVGLLAPHIARQLVGPKLLQLLPLTLVIGGLLLLSADFFGRVLLAPKEIPAGIIVSLIGAPYLLYLLKKTNRVK